MKRASIIIYDLDPAGANLFRDSESFLHELTEQEVASVLGGKCRSVVILWTSICWHQSDRSDSVSQVYEVQP